MQTPHVQAFFDPDTWTVSYVVHDPSTHDALIIDPVLDYDVLRSQTSARGLEDLVEYVTERRLTVRGIFETHAHADHISGARYLAEKFNVPVLIGAGIVKVQETFRDFFNLGEGVRVDGSQFDQLLSHGQTVHTGSLQVRALATPGHTPACMSYVIGDAVFTGDALFIEDYGTGRADFPAGSAEQLYHSVTETLYALPDQTRVFVGHDYMPNGRALRFETTILAEKERNVQLPLGRSKEDFVRFRNERDASLSPPKLIYQSVQINVFGGLLPEEESNHARYLKIPINARRRTNRAGVPIPKDAPVSAAHLRKSGV